MKLSLKLTAVCSAAFLVATPVQAQDDRLADPEGYWGVEMTDDATYDAGQWSMRNQGVSVAILLGTESRVTPAQIQEILTREINNAGVGHVAFFFEQNDVPGTGVAYAYDGDVDGPFNLAEARPAAVEAARQYLFQRRLGLE